MSSVLVTGAARGIGKAISLRLAQDGWQVYAGVRNLSDGEALAAQDSRITPVLLDVTDAKHVAALDEVLPADLTAVVNNAGIVEDGPVELLDLDALRTQFEVNVFGALAVTQAVLPRLRSTRGRIVFISSLSGRIATPGTGAYNSSKFALEGLVDALRIELRPWGIRTSLVEPGPIDTDLWTGATQMVDDTIARLTPEQQALYGGHLRGLRTMSERVPKITAPVETVVNDVGKALTASRPKARYVVGLAGKAQLIAASLTPTPVLDFVLGLASGVPRKK
ncbi:SDR family oxidoreductase [Nocardia sp. 2]|uniref:SDR family oxidoreductase n=1 Tax=Nocardia acididurans TaxID=2802282 RepID=A0ABS1MA67_9NOCA|nr:SDR family oxidoreductase [Nocardia acididurans]MBL1077476.1 SDR family oxidoreductase [Nocardia acididurans]